MNPLTVAGGVLVLVGLFLPWASYMMVDGGERCLWSFRLSPILLRFEEYAGYDQIDGVVDSGCYYFYKWDMSFIGAMCILGAFLGFFGCGEERSMLSLAGGSVAFLSMLLFPTCLPGRLPNMSMGWGGFVSALGALSLMVSMYTGLSFDGLSSYVRRVPASGGGIEKTDDDSEVRSEGSGHRAYLGRLVRFQLELLAVLGSIYSGYELSRIIYRIFRSGAITIGLGNQPLWLYRLEMFVCLYAALYWIVRIGMSILGYLMFR